MIDQHLPAQVDTVVVGGGQAGLSVSWHLQRAGVDHVVLDRGRVGDTWRSRWDSFCLVTPNWTCRLPEFPYDGPDPDGFMPRDEIVSYIERFAASFDPPYRSGVEVHGVVAANGASGSGGAAILAGDPDHRFEVATSSGPVRARNVVVAAGTFQHPKVPPWSTSLPTDITQLHSRDYRSPDQLPEGAVLVVGSGQSGCQIAEDLHLAGRTVHLSVGRAPRVPRRYRGRDIIAWLVAAGLFDVAVADNPLGPQVRFLPHPHVTGRDGGHTIDLRAFGRDGIRLHGHLVDAAGPVLRSAGDLAESLDAVDAACAQRLALLDSHIEREGIDAPPPDVETVDWQPPPEDAELDLRAEGVASIVYATGFSFDFGWIDLPVLDERGYPRYERGVTDVPGLYFCGLHWLHTWASGLFYHVGDDAGHVVDHLVAAP